MLSDFALNFAYALNSPISTAKVRMQASDFIVNEIIGFTPTGMGEHVFLQIQKQYTNTDWLARQIAKFAGVRHMDVGYAGLKDRHALTTQYFTVHLINKPEPDWQKLNNEEITVLSATRHNRKLKRGALQANQFKLILREVQGDKTEITARLNEILLKGVPNYFGEQRFGHDGQNLEYAKSLLTGEITVRDNHLRGIYLSAARSWLFNHILSTRVIMGNWNQALAGEALQLAGSHSVFISENSDELIQSRLANFDIHPTAPLWGQGKILPQGEAAILESQILEPYTEWAAALAKTGMQMERRALRLHPKQLSWNWLTEDTLELSFSLPSGSYATTVLRELVITSPLNELAENEA